MKIIGHTGDEYLAQITEEEVAIILGFRSAYDDAFRAYREKVGRSSGKLPAGTVIQVREIAAFWQAIIWKEDEATKAAKTLHALADLITTQLPRGIIVPPQKEEKDHEDTGT